MQRHYGGVRGTVLLRAACPVCGRSVPGGRVTRPSEEPARIWLRPHREPGGKGRRWCDGGEMTVAADYELTAAWGARRRAREERRRERFRNR
jgi:hypothetical protein